MIMYNHVLALNPYFGDSTPSMGLFPPTGLEYIVASMKDLVGKVTLLDLRNEEAYQDPKALSQFIRDEIDLVCVSIRWPSRFEKICDFVSQLPLEVPTVVGGYKATEEVEYLFDRCPNIDMIVRGEGEDIIKQIVEFSRISDVRHRLVFLENYDINIARYMVQGCDVWLNTPRRPREVFQCLNRHVLSLVDDQ